MAQQEITDYETSSTKSKDADFMETALKRFKLCEQAEHKNRQRGLDSDKFAMGQQWPDQVKNDRDLDNRPCLVINQIPKFERDITNELRQNRPAIKISPSDDPSIDTADVLEGMIRHILVDSHADIAFDTAVQSQVRKGFGWFRVLTDYCDPMSFDQEIKIGMIKNSFTVYCDPYAQQPDGSDANFMFVVEDVEDGDFKEQFKGSALSNFANLEGVGDKAPGWISEGAVRIAEYWVVKKDKKKIYLLKDGKTVTDKKPENKDDYIKERDTETREVKMYKINGIEILEERDWAGKYIPLIPVYGEDYDLNGERILKGIVEDMMDPQRQYNYWTSASTEAIALAPKAPFIMAEGQQEGHEVFWQSANQKNYPYLLYKPVTIDGQLAPPPNRNVAEPPVQAMMAAIRQASDDLRETTGIFNENFGQEGTATSGKAIIAKQTQGNVSTFHYGDNLVRSVRHLGVILLDLIPLIYDTARVTNMVHEDGTHELVAINQIFKHTDGTDRHYALSEGKYSVVVESGPSYSTRRQEAAAGLAQLAQAYPPIMQIAGDILVKNMDWPDAALVAKRLKVMLPPQIQAADEDQEQIPPQIKMQMAQMQEVIHKGQAAIQELSQALASKQQETSDRQRELDLKDKDLNLKAFHAKISVLKEVPGHSGEIDGLLQQVDDISGAPSQEVAMRNRQQDVQLQQVSLQQKDAELKQSQEHQQQLMAGLVGIMQAVGTLVETIKKPTVAVYGEDGRLIEARKE